MSGSSLLTKIARHAIFIIETNRGACGLAGTDKMEFDRVAGVIFINLQPFFRRGNLDEAVV
jgi:hypothetical protein